MALEQVGELELSQRQLALRPSGGAALGGAGEIAQLGGADSLRLEDVDPLQQAGEQAGRVAADLVPARAAGRRGARAESRAGRPARRPRRTGRRRPRARNRAGAARRSPPRSRSRAPRRDPAGAARFAPRRCPRAAGSGQDRDPARHRAGARRGRRSGERSPRCARPRLGSQDERRTIAVPHDRSRVSFRAGVGVHTKTVAGASLRLQRWILSTGSDSAGGSSAGTASCSPRAARSRARTEYEGRGEGGDMSLVLDRRCEDIVFEELEAALRPRGPSVVAVSEERGEVAIGSGEVGAARDHRPDRRLDERPPHDPVALSVDRRRRRRLDGRRRASASSTTSAPTRSSPLAAGAARPSTASPFEARAPGPRSRGGRDRVRRAGLDRPGDRGHSRAAPTGCGSSARSRSR